MGDNREKSLITNINVSKNLITTKTRVPVPLNKIRENQFDESSTPGYFDETESTIGPDDDDYKFSDKNKILSQTPRYQLSQYERSAAESIASILVEELDRGLVEKKQLKNKESIFDISIKVALRLLHSASREGSEDNRGFSLNEILSDQRFLSELIADTQVIIILICFNSFSFFFSLYLSLYNNKL